MVSVEHCFNEDCDSHSGLGSIAVMFGIGVCMSWVFLMKTNNCRSVCCSSQEYEREKHSHTVLQFQFTEMKETLKQSEELLNVSIRPPL